jgi:hypothetical protein
MDSRLVLTCHSTLKNEKLIQGVSLFKLPDLDTFSKDSTQSEGLENLFTVHEEGENILKYIIFIYELSETNNSTYLELIGILQLKSLVIFN